MQFLENITVGSKITILSLVLLVFMASVAGYGIHSLHTINNELNSLYDVDMNGLSAAKEANLQFLSASRALRNMALYSGKNDAAAIKRYTDNYERFSKAMWEELEKAGKCAISPDGKKTFAATTAATRRSEAQQRELIKKIAAGMEFSAAVDAITAGRPDENKADDLMTELVKTIDAEGHKRSVATDALYDSTLYIFLALLAAALLFGLLFSMLVKRAIATPLVSVAGKAAKVAAGDLNQEFHFQRSDEIGTLAAALEQMVSNLRAHSRSGAKKPRSGRAEQKSLAGHGQGSGGQRQGRSGPAGDFAGR